MSSEFAAPDSSSAPPPSDFPSMSSPDTSVPDTSGAPPTDTSAPLPYTPSSPDNFAFDTPQTDSWSTGNPNSDWGSVAPYTPSQSNPDTNNSGRLVVPGFDLNTPDTNSADSGLHGLLPFHVGSKDKQGNFSGFDPQTPYNVYNPSSALDTFSGYARALIPGLNDLGKNLGQIGDNIANSDFGRGISQTPLAGIGSWIGNEVNSAMSGVGLIAGDLFSPVGDMASAMGRGDLGGAVLDLLRVGPANLVMNNANRINGLFHGDKELTKQLGDEVSALSAIGMLFGVGEVAEGVRGLNYAREVGTDAGMAIARGTASDVAMGSGEYAKTLSPLIGAPNPVAVQALNWARAAAGIPMAAGFGAELGGTIAQGFDPTLSGLNNEIAAQRFVPEASPLRGLYDFVPAMMVDPIPAIGRMVKSDFITNLLNSQGRPFVDNIAFAEQGKFGRDLLSNLSDQEKGNRQAWYIQNAAQDQAIREGARGPMVADRSAQIQQQMTQNLMNPTSKGAYNDTLNNVLQEAHNQMTELFTREGNKNMTGAEAAQYWREFHGNSIQIDGAAKAAGLDGNVYPQVRADQATNLDFENGADFLKSQKAQVPDIQGPLKAEPAPGTPEYFNTIPGADVRPTLSPTKQTLTEDQMTQFQNEHPLVAPYTKGAKTIDQMIAKLKDAGADAYHEVSGDHPLGPIGESIRAQGNFKLVDGPRATKALTDDASVYPTHAAYKYVRDQIGKDAMKQTVNEANGAARTLGGNVGPGFQRGGTTFGTLQDILSKAKGPEAAAEFKAIYSDPETRLFNANGEKVARPFITPNPTLEAATAQGATRLGTVLANLRGFIPNTELARSARDNWTRTLMDTLTDPKTPGAGVTRESTLEFADKIREMAVRKNVGNMEAAGQGLPPNVGSEIRALAKDFWPTNPLVDRLDWSKVLADAASPRADWRDFLGTLTGDSIGKTGAFPSLTAAARSGAPANGFGDFYRWFASIGHPLVRYTGSPVFNAFIRVEPTVFNILNGAKWAPNDPILRNAMNDMLGHLYDTAGKRLGMTRPAEGFMPASEGLGARAGNTGAFSTPGQSLEAARLNHIADQAANPNTFPKYLAARYAKDDPANWNLIRKSYSSDIEAAHAVINTGSDIKRYLGGEISDEELARIAGVQPSEVKNFLAINDHVQGAMRDALSDAHTTHISNPTRSYIERSVNHPLLIYPLSWTMKATGEWAKFLTHSAFGLPTGMGGLVAWNDIKNSTAVSMANDPNAQNWLKSHPETKKILEFLMPMTPLSGGFGLLGTGMRDTLQIGDNLWHGQDPLKNTTPPWNIGAARDLNAAQKMWSEWVNNRPRTSLNRPGL